MISDRKLFNFDFTKVKQRQFDETKLVPDWFPESTQTIFHWIVAIFEIRIVRLFLNKASDESLNRPTINVVNDLKKYWESLSSDRQNEMLVKSVEFCKSLNKLTYVDNEKSLKQINSQKEFRALTPSEKLLKLILILEKKETNNTIEFFEKLQINVRDLLSSRPISDILNSSFEVNVNSIFQVEYYVLGKFVQTLQSNHFRDIFLNTLEANHDFIKKKKKRKNKKQTSPNESCSEKLNTSLTDINRDIGCQSAQNSKLESSLQNVGKKQKSKKLKKEVLIKKNQSEKLEKDQSKNLDKSVNLLEIANIDSVLKMEKNMNSLQINQNMLDLAGSKKFGNFNTCERELSEALLLENIGIVENDLLEARISSSCNGLRNITGFDLMEVGMTQTVYESMQMVTKMHNQMNSINPSIISIESETGQNISNEILDKENVKLYQNSHKSSLPKLQRNEDNNQEKKDKHNIDKNNNAKQQNSNQMINFENSATKNHLSATLISTQKQSPSKQDQLSQVPIQLPSIILQTEPDLFRAKIICSPKFSSYIQNEKELIDSQKPHLNSFFPSQNFFKNYFETNDKKTISLYNETLTDSVFDKKRTSSTNSSKKAMNALLEQNKMEKDFSLSYCQTNSTKEESRIFKKNSIIPEKENNFTEKKKEYSDYEDDYEFDRTETLKKQKSSEKAEEFQRNKSSNLKPNILFDLNNQETKNGIFANANQKQNSKLYHELQFFNEKKKIENKEINLGDGEAAKDKFTKIGGINAFGGKSATGFEFGTIYSNKNGKNLLKNTEKKDNKDKLEEIVNRKKMSDCIYGSNIMQKWNNEDEKLFEFGKFEQKKESQQKNEQLKTKNEIKEDQIDDKTQRKLNNNGKIMNHAKIDQEEKASSKIEENQNNSDKKNNKVIRYENSNRVQTLNDGQNKKSQKIIKIHSKIDAKKTKYEGNQTENETKVGNTANSTQTDINKNKINTLNKNSNGIKIIRRWEDETENVINLQQIPTNLTNSCKLLLKTEDRLLEKKQHLSQNDQHKDFKNYETNDKPFDTENSLKTIYLIVAKTHTNDSGIECQFQYETCSSKNKNQQNKNRDIEGDENIKMTNESIQLKNNASSTSKIMENNTNKKSQNLNITETLTFSQKSEIKLENRCHPHKRPDQSSNLKFQFEIFEKYPQKNKDFQSFTNENYQRKESSYSAYYDQKGSKRNQNGFFNSSQNDSIKSNQSTKHKTTQTKLRKMVDLGLENILQNDIHSIHSNINNSTIELKKNFKSIKKLIANSIQQVFPDNPNYSCVEYGSSVTNLITPFSDLDLGIVSNTVTNRQFCLEILRKLEGHLKDRKWLKSMNFLFSAAIPVLKLTCDLSEKPFGYENQNEIKVDLIVIENDLLNLLPSAFRTTEFIQQCMISYPPMYKINLVLKYLLNLFQLTNSYKGGLCSYGLSILVVNFLLLKRFEQSSKLGWIIHEFINYFANEFNPKSMIVSLKKLNL